jgi:hypothetical protein
VRAPALTHGTPPPRVYRDAQYGEDVTEATEDDAGDAGGGAEGTPQGERGGGAAGQGHGEQQEL